MPLVLNGATSGSTTIQATDAVTATLTLPSATGTLVSTASPASGNVIQVVNATYSTETGTTSTSFVATGLAASITPKFSSSKVLILMSITTYEDANKNSWVTVYRGTTSGTNLGNGNNGFGSGYSASAGKGVVSCAYVDSPATTSATTYTVAFRVDSGTQYVCSNNSTATLTLMEIAQ